MVNVQHPVRTTMLFSLFYVRTGSVRLNSIRWKLHDEIWVDSRKRDRGSLTSKRVQLSAIGSVLIASSTFNEQGPRFSSNMVFFCYCLIINSKGRSYRPKGLAISWCNPSVSWASLTNLLGSLARDNKKSAGNLEYYLERGSDISKDPEHCIKVSIQPAP